MAADKERGHGTASAEIGKYLDILAKDPHSRVFAPLAEAYRKAGLIDDAIATALEGLKVHPNYLGGRVALGRAYFENRQYAEAAAEMQRVVTSAPDNLMAHRVLGQIARAQNDLPTAEKAFRMVLLLDPGDQEARQFVANVGGAASAAQPPPRPMGMAQAQAVRDVEPAHPPHPEQPPPPVVTAPPPPRPEEPAPPSFESVPFAEIPPLEGLEPLPGAQVMHEPPPAPPSPTREIALDQQDEFAIESPLELAEAETLSSPASPPPSGEAEEIEMDLSEGFEIEPSPELAEAAPLPSSESSPAAADIPQEPGPDEALELEVFTREAWGKRASETAASVSEEPAAPEEELSIEIFGRSKRGGPPQTVKGEETPFREISFEPAEQEESVEPLPEEESPFEIFTREPAVRAARSPSEAGEGEEAGARAIEIETTAYMPPDSFRVAVDEEELPRLDLTREIERGAPERRDPVSAPETVPQPETEPELDIAALSFPLAPEQDVEPGPEMEREPGFEPAPELEPAPPGEPTPEPEFEPAAVSSESEPVVAPGPTFEPAPELEPEALPVTQPEFEPPALSWPPEAEPEIESIPPFEPEPTFEPELESSLFAEPGLSPEPEPELETSALSLPPASEPDVEPGPGFETEQVVETAQEPRPEPTPAFAEQDRATAGGLSSPQAPSPARTEENYEELSEEEPSSAAFSKQGVFDTETLAAIYVNQGFFGRAAAIYQRLLVQRPGDVELRRKLDELSVLQRGEADRGGPAAPSALTAVPAPAAAAEPDTPEARVDRLERLLEAFRRERPR